MAGGSSKGESSWYSIHAPHAARPTEHSAPVLPLSFAPIQPWPVLFVAGIQCWPQAATHRESATLL
ncbi:hypothetical protein N7461_003692 [Penicillium sp. DV-2018c]|nr:hypothetical protein N7461_003692 [Penicillium sp. DV-2018c]